MAKRKRESGDERQERIQREQHRREQNRGYDEAVKGGAGVANDRPDRMVPVSGDESQLQNTTEDVDEREAHSGSGPERPSVPGQVRNATPFRVRSGT